MIRHIVLAAVLGMLFNSFAQDSIPTKDLPKTLGNSKARIDGKQIILEQNYTSKFKQVSVMNLPGSYAGTLSTPKTKTKAKKVVLTQETITNGNERTSRFKKHTGEYLSLPVASQKGDKYYKTIDKRQKALVLRNGNDQKIFNAQGELVGEYSTNGFALGDGRLLRFNWRTRTYEMLSPNSKQAQALVGGIDRELNIGDRWFGNNIFYNDQTGDVIVNSGVVIDGQEMVMTYVVDKNNHVLWHRNVEVNRKKDVRVWYSLSGDLFSLFKSSGSLFDGDLEIINRQGETILEIENITTSFRENQIIASDGKYLVTLLTNSEIIAYDLSDGQAVKHIKGYYGRGNIMRLDYAADTQEIFALMRKPLLETTVMELVVFPVVGPKEDVITKHEVVTLPGLKRTPGSISVSDDGTNVTVGIRNRIYELERIKD